MLLVLLLLLMVQWLQLDILRQRIFSIQNIQQVLVVGLTSCVWYHHLLLL
jgi:hypothetical protein